MKPTSRNRFLAAAALAFASFTVAVSADTVTANATARTLAPNQGDQGALSLFSDGVSNIQRSWLNFDVSAYTGKAMVGDVTMTLQAGIYGNTLTGVQLGSANTAWSAGTITWGTQPPITIIPGVTNPNGTVGPTGPVTWTIPGYAIEKWATLGYNGIGLTSGAGSSQHFYSLADANPSNHPTLTLTSADGANGTWTGGSGNWTDGANWASNTVAQGIDKTATINGGTAVTVTMDASRSIGALVFSGANHSLASGAGQLGLVKSTGIPSISVASGTTASVSATLLGLDGLEKLGTGTLALSGANNYLGTTTVSEGTLSLASATALPASRPVAISAGAVVSNDAPANTSFNLGALTLTGGTLAATAAPASDLGNYHLKGTVTVSGSTASTISADVRVIQNDNREFNVADDATGVDLLISGKLGHYNGNTWGYATKTGDGTMKLSGPVEIGGITVNGGTLLLEDAAADWGAFESTNGGLKNNSQVEIAVTSGSRSAAVAISGTGTLTKTGSGTAALTGSTTHSGGTTVSQGILSLGNGTNSTSLNDAAPVDIASGAKIDLNFTGTDVIGSLILNGTDAGTGVFDATSHSTYFTGTGKLFVLGAIADGSGTWTSSANGMWEIPGNWQSGTVASGEDQTATFNGATGTTVTLAGNVTIGNLSFSTLNYTITGNSLTLANTLGTSAITVADTQTATIASGIAGTVVLEKLGLGTLALNGSITYSGGTTVTAGTLALPDGDWSTGNPWGAGGANGAIIVGSGATLSTSAGVTEIKNGITLNGGTISSRGLTYGPDAWGNIFLSSNIIADGAATSTISSQITLTNNRDITVETGSTLNITGKITNWNNPSSGINKYGPGTLALSNTTNTYTGYTNVVDGTLILGDGTNNTNLADGSDVSIDTGATLQLNYLAANTDTINKLFLEGVQVASGTWGSLASSATHKTSLITGDGILNVLSDPPVTDPYASWIDTYFTGVTDPLIIGATADPDNDGIDNLVEYVLQGGNPSVSTTGILPTLNASGTDFVFTFFRRAAGTGTTQTFQHGSTLTGWTDVPVVNGGEVAITPDTPSAGIDQVVITIPKGTNTKLFGRLQVVK